MQLLSLTSIVLLGLIGGATSIQLELGFGQRKCFNEEVPVDRPLLVDFHCAAGSTAMELDLFVTNMDGQVLLHKSGLSHHRATLDAPGVADSNHHVHYHAPIFTTYRFCLMHQTMPGQVSVETERKVEFEIRPATAKSDTAKALSSSQASGMHDVLRELEGEVIGLLQKIDSLREQERVLTVTNEAMSRFVVTLSSLTSLLVIAVGMLQLEFIQVILKRRKFIR